MKSTQVFSKRKLDQSIMQFALLTLVILGLGGYFGYVHYTEYQAAQTALGTETQKLDELRSSAEQSKQNFLALKKELDTQNLTVNQAIEQILPANEDFTNLARSLDKYFLDSRVTAHPMFLSNLSFSQPLIEDSSELATLPFTMSLTGDEEGLKSFLKYTQNSGDLNAKTRLLDLSNISLNFVELTEEENAAGDILTTTISPGQRNVSSNLTLKAFYQKPLTLPNP